MSYHIIYASSTSENELTPSITEGTITNIIASARNPYLINDGTGWINDDCINNNNENTSEPESPDIEESTGLAHSIGEYVTYSPSYDTYEVESGDCLSAIGDKLGVDWCSIAEANGIGEPYTIYPGQSLIIPR